MPKAESEKSTAVYSRMARYYDLLSSKNVDYRALTDYLERVFAKHKKLGKSGSILDVACGTGNYTFMLANDGCKVTGIDVSGDMLRVARSKAASKTNPVFLKMDMRKIQLKDKYDIVAVLFGGFGCLLTRDDVGRFLAGARKVLRPDGLLVFEFGQDSAVYPADESRSGNTSWDKVEDGSKSIIRLHLSKYDPQTNKLSFGWDLMVVDHDTKKASIPSRRLTQ